MSKTFKDQRSFKDIIQPKKRNKAKPLTPQEKRIAKQLKSDMIIDKFMEHGLAG